jgi:hypothetical protein
MRTRRHLLGIVLLSAVYACAQKAPIIQQLSFAPDHASGIYELGQTV